MRIGRISAYSTEGFDVAQAQGMQFIEICCNNDIQASAVVHDAERIKENVRRTGISVSSVGRWNHTLIENGEINAPQLQSYVELLQTAIDLGARTFVCGVNRDESLSYEQNVAMATEILGTLIAAADGRIKVAVENCGWNNFLITPREWDTLFSALPELYIKYDPSHAYKRGQDYLAELSDYGHRVAHVHVKGIVRAGKTAIDDPPAGMDDLRWPAIFGILYARGYRGDLSIEPHSETWSGDLEDFGVRFTRDYIRPFVYPYD